MMDSLPPVMQPPPSIPPSHPPKPLPSSFCCMCGCHCLSVMIFLNECDAMCESIGGGRSKRGPFHPSLPSIVNVALLAQHSLLFLLNPPFLPSFFYMWMTLPLLQPLCYIGLFMHKHYVTCLLLSQSTSTYLPTYLYPHYYPTKPTSNSFTIVRYTNTDTIRAIGLH